MRLAPYASPEIFFALLDIAAGLALFSNILLGWQFSFLIGLIAYPFTEVLLILVAALFFALKLGGSSLLPGGAVKGGWAQLPVIIAMYLITYMGLALGFLLTLLAAFLALSLLVLVYLALAGEQVGSNLSAGLVVLSIFLIGGLIRLAKVIPAREPVAALASEFAPTIAFMAVNLSVLIGSAAAYKIDLAAGLLALVLGPLFVVRWGTGSPRLIRNNVIAVIALLAVAAVAYAVNGITTGNAYAFILIVAAWYVTLGAFRIWQLRSSR